MIHYCLSRFVLFRLAQLSLSLSLCCERRCRDDDREMHDLTCRHLLYLQAAKHFLDGEFNVAQHDDVAELVALQIQVSEGERSLPLPILVGSQTTSSSTGVNSNNSNNISPSTTAATTAGTGSSPASSLVGALNAAGSAAPVVTADAVRSRVPKALWSSRRANEWVTAVERALSSPLMRSLSASAAEVKFVVAVRRLSPYYGVTFFGAARLTAGALRGKHKGSAIIGVGADGIVLVRPKDRVRQKKQKRRLECISFVRQRT